MMIHKTSDTIYALATPPGKSAIAIIRISGERASKVAALFGQTQPKPRVVTVMTFKDENGEAIDDGVFFWFRGPYSSTGEDVAEIQCHGSSAVIARLLDRLAELDGFRMAQPGEFTRRALDNAKMDITQVEGLADLIEAETALQHRQAMAQLTGRLRKPVQRWRDSLIANLGHLEAVIDFADEDLPNALANQIKQHTSNLISDLQDAIDDRGVGELIRSGFQLAIIGPVNAGKSTALNGLAKRPAAIVSDIEGTTRDLVEVKLDIGGIPVVVTDTAGWRHTPDDPIEAEGIERAQSQAQQASFRIIMLDCSQADWQHQAEIFSKWGTSDALIIANKSDKGVDGDVPTHICELPVRVMSMNEPSDIIHLEQYLAARLSDISTSAQHVLVTRARHREAINHTCARLQASLELDISEDPELVAEEFRAAAACLGQILGHVDVEDVLAHIFSQFCIGK